MSAEESQKEELEVLDSIYDGDSAFKQINGTTFQYKYGDEGDYKSFIVEVGWPEEYPNVAPSINLDLFYNKHILSQVKDTIKAGLLEQIEDLLGMSMTFSLFEWVKDNLDTVLAEQPDTPPVQAVTQTQEHIPEESSSKKEPKEKKEQLSKSQKRRMMDRFGAATERPRGWDWVDIVKHLSQTGGQS